jgi:nitrogen fixation/metabolism regulation signal transduction histidine kinase
MNIKTKLYLSVGISAVLLVLVLVSFYISSSTIFKEREKSVLSGNIKTMVFDLEVLSNDYLLNREERAVQQWESRYKSGQALLQNFDNVTREGADRAEVQSISTDFALIGNLFQEVVRVHGDANRGSGNPSEKEMDLQADLEDRLASRLSILSQSMVSSTVILENRAISKLVAAETLNRNATLLSLILVLVIITLTFLKVSRDITIPIEHLIKVNKAISMGKLQSRANIKTGDEFEQLGKATDRMVVDLRASYVKARGLESAKEKSAELHRMQLQEKVKELERWRRVTVGRELRIKELKAEIIRLKQNRGKKNQKNHDWSI